MIASFLRRVRTLSAQLPRIHKFSGQINLQKGEIAERLTTDVKQETFILPSYLVYSLSPPLASVRVKMGQSIFFFFVLFAIETINRLVTAKFDQLVFLLIFKFQAPWLANAILEKKRLQHMEEKKTNQLMGGPMGAGG